MNDLARRTYQVVKKNQMKNDQNRVKCGKELLRNI